MASSAARATTPSEATCERGVRGRSRARQREAGIERDPLENQFMRLLSRRRTCARGLTDVESRICPLAPGTPVATWLPSEQSAQSAADTLIRLQQPEERPTTPLMSWRTSHGWSAGPCWRARSLGSPGRATRAGPVQTSGGLTGSSLLTKPSGMTSAGPTGRWSLPTPGQRKVSSLAYDVGVLVLMQTAGRRGRTKLCGPDGAARDNLQAELVKSGSNRRFFDRGEVAQIVCYISQESQGERWAAERLERSGTGSVEV